MQRGITETNTKSLSNCRNFVKNLNFQQVSNKINIFFLQKLRFKFLLIVAYFSDISKEPSVCIKFFVIMRNIKFFVNNQKLFTWKVAVRVVDDFLTNMPKTYQKLLSLKTCQSAN